MAMIIIICCIIFFIVTGNMRTEMLERLDLSIVGIVETWNLFRFGKSKLIYFREVKIISHKREEKVHINQLKKCNLPNIIHDPASETEVNIDEKKKKKLLMIIQIVTMTCISLYIETEILEQL